LSAFLSEPDDEVLSPFYHPLPGVESLHPQSARQSVLILAVH
jgi:hypothetical protein